MNSYTIKEKLIPCDDVWDVIVAGGGPSGSAAAAAAAREGAKTLLIEQTGCLGGMGTSGLVPAWCPFSDGEKFIYGGIAKRVFEASKKGMAHVPDDAIHGWLPLDPEALKRIYDDLVTQSGAKILFNTQVAAVESDDGETIEAIIVANKSGLSAYKAKVFVDCTGDGDLAAWAGAEYKKGDEETGDLQPATLCFILSNADSYAFTNGQEPLNNNKAGNWRFKESAIFKILDSGKYPEIKDASMCGNLIGPGTIGINSGHVFGVDNTNPESTSKALMIGRKTSAALRNALAEFNPKIFANAHLTSTGSLLGIRETRRIVGDYYLTIEDYFRRRSFPDEIARNSYKIDVHASRGDLQDTKSYEGFQKYDNDDETLKGLYTSFGKGESHGIPYRCLTPKGLKNILIAGRCISTDRKVQGSVRVMPACLSTGEAAGMAAAHAVKQISVDVHAVDTKYLRERLIEVGGYLT